MYLQAPLSAGTNRTSVVAVSPSKGPTTSSSSSEDFCRGSASSTKINAVSYYILYRTAVETYSAEIYMLRLSIG